MNEINQPITFRQLLEKCQRIEVPRIQRDYAQGRETAREVRNHFLKALYDALVRAPGYSLNLDFVYGSMEDGPPQSFLPLDGQQRLTTLFLLHWYLAWRDERLPEFQSMMQDGRHSRFTYGVRPSSGEFFDKLVHYFPQNTPDEVPAIKKLLENQPWFFLYWRLDPTVQAALVMLEAIHERFSLTRNLFARLIDVQQPAVTFLLLPPEDFGLTDDLYIKMNARGKPLTTFETFKARFEELLKEKLPIETRQLGNGTVSVAEFFERRIDTQWANFFWTYRSPKTNTFDDAVMNLFVALALISLDPTSLRFDEDTTELRKKQFSDTFSFFHERGWLTGDFTNNLINLLEAWSRGNGKLVPVLPNSNYFDEEAFFQKVIQGQSAIDYTQIIQFAAFVFSLQHYEGSVNAADLNEWMRVVRNLAINSDIERPEEYGRCLTGLRKLSNSKKILEHLSVQDIGQVGFSPLQIREEALKAKLIVANTSWRSRIDAAESHGYFVGQIDFLLDFCGASAAAKKTPVIEWEAAQHERLQAAFDQYLRKAHITFNASGLTPTASSGFHIWKRALLTFGDYLFSVGPNYSFLADQPSRPDSWKRFLRSRSEKIAHLKGLWDSIDSNAEIDPQLNRFVESASGLEPWRAAIVKHPEIISYCGQQQVRRNNSDEIYLLYKTQMNGAHAELYSYALYFEIAKCQYSIAPLSLQPYQFKYGTTEKPHILLAYERLGCRVSFAVEWEKDQFHIYTGLTEVKNFPEIETALCAPDGQFSIQTDKVTRLAQLKDIHQTLRDLAKILSDVEASATRRLREVFARL
jgi:hypothetical protein